jgi:TolA-binding protein
MGKKLFAIAMIVGLCLTGASAQEQQEKKESGLSVWLRDLQKKMEQIIPKKAPVVTTSVAGVRGAKEDAAPRLYWMGKKGQEAVTEKELAEFKSAVELIQKGEAQTAAQKLEEFMKQNPDSALIPDVKKTLDMVKADTK